MESARVCIGVSGLGATLAVALVVALARCAPAPLPAPAPRCPPSIKLPGRAEALSVGGSQVVFSTAHYNHTVAAAMCADIGMEMARISEDLVPLMDALRGPFWIHSAAPCPNATALVMGADGCFARPGDANYTFACTCAQ